MRTTWLWCLVALLVAAVVHASNVVDLTDTKLFDEVVGKDVGVLVEYFAPWCGHCKKLGPEYEKLADAFSSKKNKVVIAKVDGDSNRELSNRINLRGFPTILYYPPHSEDGVEFSGARTLEGLAAFVTEQSHVRSRVEPPKPPAVVEVTAADFDKVVMDPTADVLVDFYASWCGHCKKLAPLYEEVAKVFERDSSCKIVQINADDPENADIKKRFQIQSYPTISFFPAGSDDKWPRPYLKERTLEDFVAFLNEKCGTFRNVDGTLSSFAGRMPALDGFASRFYAAGESARKAIVGETKKYFDDLTKSVNSARKVAAAEYYMRVMDRVNRDGPDYVKRESDRLNKILKKNADGLTTLTLEKVDDITRKVNVLSAFMNEKIGKAAERASSSAAEERAKATASSHDEL